MCGLFLLDCPFNKDQRVLTEGLGYITNLRMPAQLLSPVTQAQILYRATEASQAAY